MGRARRKDKESGSSSPGLSSSASSSCGGIGGPGGVPFSGTEAKLYVEPSVLECTVPEPKIRELVSLPAGLDYNEWLASHTIAFFDHINLLYGTISEYCTMSGCPDMTGPKLRQYLWLDEKGKKAKVTAPQYIDYVMTFTQKTVNDESIFPTKFERDFPVSFEATVKKIHRLLFHVVAHLYHGHFQELVLLNLHAHLNCLFIHFTLFNESFNVVEEKETEVLRDLAMALKLYPDARAADASESSSKGDPALLGLSSSGESGTRSPSPQAGEGPDGGRNPRVLTQPPTSCYYTPDSPLTSINALHSRSGSSPRLHPGGCAMDSALVHHQQQSSSNDQHPTSRLGSSPIKFQ